MFLYTSVSCFISLYRVNGDPDKYIEGIHFIAPAFTHMLVFVLHVYRKQSITLVNTKSSAVGTKWVKLRFNIKNFDISL